MRNRLMTQNMQPKHRETRTSPRGTDVSAKGVFRFSVAYFLCVLILNILVAPFVDQFPGGLLVQTALMTLVFLSALLAIGGRLRTLSGAVLVAPALMGEWLSYSRVLAMAEAVFGMFYVTLLIARLVSRIHRAPFGSQLRGAPCGKGWSLRLRL